MTPDIEVLREVDAIGGRVWLEGERVRYSLPADRCDLVDRLREQKAKIVAALATPAPTCPAPVPDHRTLIQTDAGVAAAAHAFHNHLFGPGQATGCCAARHGRYCAEGARLRADYHEAHRTAEGRQ